MLRHKNDLRLLASMEYLLSACEAALRAKHPQVRQAISDAADRCNAGERLRGAVYILHNELWVAMRSSDGSRVKELLRRASDLRFTTTNLVIKGLSDSSVGAFDEDALFMSTMGRENEQEYQLLFDAKPPEGSDVDILRDVNEVLNRLRVLDPATASELEVLVSDVIVMSSAYLNGGTSFKAFGYLMLRERRARHEWTTYLETLVHEAAHLYLYSLWTLDPIILDDGGRLYRSPLRREPRPLSGIFHAMFVLGRIMRTMRIFEQSEYADDVAHLESSYNNAGNTASLERKFEDAYQVVQEHAELSPLGAALLASCRAMAAGEQ
jgi:hypothetical protein